MSSRRRRPTMRPCALLAATVLLAACTPAATPTPRVPAPARPPVPGGWTSVRTDAGDAELTIPRDLDVLLATSGILVQGEAMATGPALEIWLTGPRDAQPQPAAGQSLRAWLEAGSWIPTDGGTVTLADLAEREVWLPAGRALEVAMTVQPGTGEASRVVAYAVVTDAGVAVLRILGSPDVIADRADDLRRVAQLLRFPGDE